MRQAYRCVEDVKASLARHAEVVVASCIGAHSLIEAEAGPFELVVLDEAAQTTEPALCCALGRREGGASGLLRGHAAAATDRRER